MFTFLTIFLIGFFLGRWTLSKEDVKSIRKLIKPHLKPGILKRPTASHLRKKGTKEAEGEKEMTKTFEKIAQV